MKIDKKRFLDSIVLSVIVINLFFMILFAAGIFRLSTPLGDTVVNSEDVYSNKVSYTIAETDSADPPFYLNIGLLTLINVLSILLFAGLVYFAKHYFGKKDK